MYSVYSFLLMNKAILLVLFASEDVWYRVVLFELYPPDHFRFSFDIQEEQ